MRRSVYDMGCEMRQMHLSEGMAKTNSMELAVRFALFSCASRAATARCCLPFFLIV
jgi:hypothetical protein